MHENVKLNDYDFTDYSERLRVMSSVHRSQSYLQFQGAMDLASVLDLLRAMKTRILTAMDSAWKLGYITGN